MAKVKTAKDKITAYLKGKGLDTSDIKDAFDELDAADVDIEKLAEATVTNQKWLQYHNETVLPEFQKVSSERDALKSKIEKLSAAGVKFDGSEPIKPAEAAQGANGNYVSKEDLAAFRMELANAASDTMEQLVRINSKHTRRFNQDVDFDALKKLMAEKDSYGRQKFQTVEDAYRIWSKPERAKRKGEQQQAEVDRLVKERLTAELSKQGFAPPSKRKQSEEIEYNLRKESVKTPKSYSKLTPEEQATEDRASKEAFLTGLNEETN